MSPVKLIDIRGGGERVGMEINHRTARKIGPLYIIQYSGGKADSGNGGILFSWLCFEVSRKPSPNFSTFMKPRNGFQGINSTSLCSLAGQYDNPVPSLHRLLKIPALNVLSYLHKL